ncbi:MAG: cysteine desulfurase [Ignavibacteria bacterium]|jgi:cysteine desulfurase/selenocysteine lyase|nr:cysteine desulfurase [Ignavibacteria bacterium]
MFDVEKIRQDFPILGQKVHGKNLVYMDNAATTQKPKCVIGAIAKYYSELNSNVHRGVHSLSDKATTAYEKSRAYTAKFINASNAHEIIFVRGTTEAINLVASSYGNEHVKDGDEVIVSHLEHHSNIVPWQMLCERKNAKLKVIPVNDRGELIIEEYKKLLSPRAKIVAVNHTSNSLGTMNPVKEIIRLAHEAGAVVLIDGAQAVQHNKVDVRDLDADFFAFSGHKVYGPTGIGVLYGKENILEMMQPYQGGGEMIKNVSFEKTTYNDLPYRFEAGTPDIAGAIVLSEALKYVEHTGLHNIAKHEKELLKYATGKLSEIEGFRIYGTSEKKASVISFLLEGIHPYDVGTILDRQGIAVRTGHHCTEPLMNRFGIPGTVRASFAVYNTKAEIDMLAEGLKKAKKMLT